MLHTHLQVHYILYQKDKRATPVRYKQCYFGCPEEVNFQMRAPPVGERVIKLYTLTVRITLLIFVLPTRNCGLYICIALEERK